MANGQKELIRRSSQMGGPHHGLGQFPRSAAVSSWC